MKQAPDLAYAKEAATLLQNGFVIVDFEGTSSCEDPQVAIVQIGVIDYTGRVLMDTLVKPGRSIEEGAERVHGISDRDAAGAPAFKRVYPELSGCLCGKKVAAWNDAADRHLLEATCRRHQLPAIEPDEWVDASSLYSCFRRANRSYTLSAACKQMGIPVIRTHRAIDDCLLTLMLIQKIAQQSIG